MRSGGGGLRAWPRSAGESASSCARAHAAASPVRSAVLLVGPSRARVSSALRRGSSCLNSAAPFGSTKSSRRIRLALESARAGDREVASSLRSFRLRARISARASGSSADDPAPLRPSPPASAPRRGGGGGGGGRADGDKCCCRWVCAVGGVRVWPAPVLGGSRSGWDLEGAVPPCRMRQICRARSIGTCE